MKRRFVPALALLFSTSTLCAAPEAIEIAKDTMGELPAGKEADGIIGDFVLRNDLVEATISGNAPLRRANMSTFYGAGNETPGCLYDLALRGSGKEEITVFTPCHQRGRVSWVRIVSDGSDGEAVVETVTTAARDGLSRMHRYRLREGWQGVLIESEIVNESDKVREDLQVQDGWQRFDVRGTFKGISWADSIDPLARTGYAYSLVDEQSGATFPRRIALAPGESLVRSRFLAVGQSPAEAVSRLLERRKDLELGTWKGTVRGEDGDPVIKAKITVQVGGEKLLVYPDEQGAFEISLPLGKHSYTVSDRGREPVKAEFSVGLGKTTENAISMTPASTLKVEVRGQSGSLIPCKLMFKGIGGTPTPDLGTVKRAHGCKDQYHSERGDFSVALDPGRYEVTATRGPEFSSHVAEVEIKPGETVDFQASLERVVDTKGWISADFHNHSTPSGDNNCSTEDRIINIAAEHVEFAPTTEHNRIDDWQPEIDALGLTKEIFTVPGLELTGPGAHLNTFPLTVKPGLQDGGAPVWVKDPRINSLNLRRYNGTDTNRWVQINHPSLTELFFDRNGDGKIDNGWFQLGPLLDGFETENYRDTHILGDGPFRVVQGKGISRTVRENRGFIWLQMLNQGHRTWGVAVCDAHTVYSNGVGGWRTYLPTTSDEPSEQDIDDLVEHARAGHMMLTSGPFLEVGIEGEKGVHYGDTIKAAKEELRLQVKVQCTDWVDVDRVQVLVNGSQVPELNFTRESHPDWFKEGVVRFDQKIKVTLEEDAHLIVVAIDEDGDLSGGFGTSPAASVKPCAYHNPFFVDVDGGGFTANGDTLGWDLPVKGVSVDQVEKMLEVR